MEKEPSVNSSLLLDLSDEVKDIPPPYLESLWSYGCNLTQDNNVSCMAWNRMNPVSDQSYIYLKYLHALSLSDGLLKIQHY